MEAPESVTANVDTRIGDGLRTLLNNGTELTGTVVGNDYQITVTKGQNIGFYSDSVDEYIVRFSSSNDSKFEFADYDETVNNSFGIDRTYRKTQKGHYFIVTALDDGIISVPSEAKDSIEIKSVTSPALKHNTAKAGQSYELKLADNWNEEVEIEDNYNNHDWLEFSMYNSDGTVEDGWFGMNTYFIKTLSKKSNHVREVITSIVEDDVDVIYPYQYDTTAITFTESKTPALKHNTVEAGESYEIKLSDGWSNSVNFVDDYHNHNWLEYSMYNLDGTVDDGWFGMDTYYIRALDKESNHVREVITSIVKEDVDVAYPYEYDVKAVTFTKSETPALKHNTVEAGESYEIKLSDSWNNKVNFEDNYHNHNWLEYSIYNSDGISNSSWFSTDMYYIQGLNKDEDCVREVITSIVDEDVDVAYPYEYDVKAVTFTESTAPALKRQTVKAKHSYEIKLIGDCENDVQLKDDVYGEWLEYAVYDKDGINRGFGNSERIHDLSINNNIRESITSTSDYDGVVMYPYEYDNKIVEFKESEAQALKHQTVKSKQSYEIKLVNGWEDNVNLRDNIDGEWLEYAAYDAIGAVKYYGNSAWIQDLNKNANSIKEVITSTVDEDVDVTYPNEYDEKAITFIESTAPALARQIIELEKSYQIKLKEGQTVNPTFRADDFDIEYAIYKNNGECYKYGDDGNGAYIYREMSVSNGITDLVFTSKAEENKELIYPYEYGINMMTLSEIETPALLRKTIKTGHSYELKLVDENVNEFCLYNVTDVEYAIYGDDGQCSDFGKDYEYNNFILNRKYNETRLVITATGNVDYDVVIPAQYDNKVITFD